MTTDTQEKAVLELSSVGTRVEVLEKEVGEINTRLVNLDDKFDRVMSGFASEFRNSISSISSQFSANQKTPWGVLMSGGSLLLTVVIVVGGLAFAPLRGEINTLEAELVPRREVESRIGATNARILVLEETLRRDKDREIERLQRQVDQLKQTYWPRPEPSR